MPSDGRILGPKRPVVDMDTDRTGLLISLLPKIPLITRVIILHLLRYSEQSKYWDMRTEVIIAMLRSYMSPPKPLSITATQRLLVQDLEFKGRIWISRYTCPAPEDRGVADAVKSAIDALRDDDVKVRSELRLPDVAAVEAEWTGYRADATPESRLPDVSEKEKYNMMMKGVTSSATILYLHGGAFWLMDPATHRTTTKRLAKVSGGRCYSVRYRLSPQHVFPAALMDALTSYLALLYPPPEAFHDPVPAEHIVFAGDRYVPTSWGRPSPHQFSDGQGLNIQAQRWRKSRTRSDSDAPPAPPPKYPHRMAGPEPPCASASRRRRQLPLGRHHTQFTLLRNQCRF